ncbi:cytochrome b5-like heme/steroid binding domain-containing protein [Methanosarcina barkeri]|uniref:Heme/steroid-binding domain-containing protein n=2 Tax=Methanosarcina barkeri TaxID=2208 RepID=A0A0G3CHA2_METBA|nr:cytochrome b5 domain-containing protein [Methanosarcina barkeri]AKB58500.1 hypothetical protein MSBR2_1984 [Methanosarcina barkeri 227]AKJ39288.1 heme/steroid-binding domain-containing protein [Methanosarcina barkeri CM1]
MRKALIILVVLFGIFLATGCAGNKQVTPNETGTPEQAVTPAEGITEAVKETPVTEISPVEEGTPTIKNTTERQTAIEMQNMTRKSELKEYTLKELTEYNGENGTAYVAYQSQVYNVSDSDIWKNGTHKGCNAGTDLTGKMDKTPHGAAILKGYPVVGTLKK